MATQQEILSWLAANPQATDRDIAAAMNQYGVSTGDLAGATGWDAGAVNDRYGVANAQNYIDTQWSGDGSIPGWGAAFTPSGTFDAGNTQRNYGVLGALDGMGLTRDQQARVTGLDAGAIDSFAQQYAPQVDIYKSIYQSDLANPAPYMQPMQPMQPTSNQTSSLGATQPSPSPLQTGISNDQITGWLSSNPGATDQQIRSAMNQYGVGVNQMADATGMGYGDVLGRYNAAAPSAPAPNAGGPTPSYANTTPALGGGYNPMINDLSQHGTAGTSPYSLGGQAQGMFGSMFGGYQASPWLSATADEIGRRTQQGLGQAFNSIRSNSIRNGTLGGSRQGVAEGIATRGAMDSLQGQLAGLYGGDWTNAQNRYLTNQGQQMNFYQGQRGQDLQQLGLGAQVYDMGVRGGWQPLQTANGIFNTTAGNNVTQTSGGTQGGGWQGLLGGAMGAGQYARNMGWW